LGWDPGNSSISQIGVSQQSGRRSSENLVFANWLIRADFWLPEGGFRRNPKDKNMTESLQETVPSGLVRPSGARRLNLQMLMMRDRANSFAGLPRGTAKPMLILAAFEEAEPYLGLPTHAFKLTAWLVKKTQPHDWEEGSRPIAWPSAREQQEFLGLSDSQVKHLNRILFEAGVFVMRDNEQGKRYGRRGHDKRIIEAFGFDLSPLAQRYDEFVRIAADAKVERRRMKDLRRRVTLARRGVRQIGEELIARDAVPADWPRLVAETASLVAEAGCRVALWMENSAGTRKYCHLE
jgi:hypothetical protein